MVLQSTVVGDDFDARVVASKDNNCFAALGVVMHDHCIDLVLANEKVLIRD